MTYYLCESVLYFPKYLEKPQSFIASTCCYLGFCLTNITKEYPKNFEEITGYSKREIDNFKRKILKVVMKVREFDK